MSAFARASSRRDLERARRVLGVDESSAATTSIRSSSGPSKETGWGQAIDALILYAAPSASQLRLAQILLIGSCGASLAGLAVFKSPVFLISLALGVVGPVLWLKRRAFHRAETFERDYPAMLLSLSSSIRTGLDPLVALQRTGELFSPPSEVGNELQALCQNLERGLTEEQAVRLFGRSIQHPDIRLFQTAFLLARREGSSLSACLQRLVRVTRNRQSFRRKMRGAVAMQKLSALGIAGCAVAIVCIQATTNLGAIKLALEHPVGSRMLAAGLALMSIGIVWMLRMSKARL